MVLTSTIVIDKALETANLTVNQGVNLIEKLIFYSCNMGSSTVDLANRANPKSISFSEWIYFLIQINHYNKSLRAI